MMESENGQVPRKMFTYRNCNEDQGKESDRCCKKLRVNVGADNDAAMNAHRRQVRFDN